MIISFIFPSWTSRSSSCLGLGGDGGAGAVSSEVAQAGGFKVTTEGLSGTSAGRVTLNYAQLYDVRRLKGLELLTCSVTSLEHYDA